MINTNNYHKCNNCNLNYELMSLYLIDVLKLINKI